jgi:hypothetical protein
VGDRGSRATENGVGVAQGLYRPGPMRVPYWDRRDPEGDEGASRSRDGDDATGVDGTDGGHVDLEDSSTAA